MQVVGRVRVDMKPVKQIMRRLGINSQGDVQKQATKMVWHRITRYMPFRSGALSTKLKIIESPTEIKVLGPYAHYQYCGKVWAYPDTGRAGHLTENGWRSNPKKLKVETDRDLSYEGSREKNPRAGPFWDRALMAAEGAQMQAELQAYVNRRAGK